MKNFVIFVLLEFATQTRTLERTSEAKRYEYRSYEPSLPVPLCKPAYSVRYPSTEEDVVQIVKEAIALKTTVKAFGSRHSATDIICTNGIPVDMTHFRGMKLNPENNTIRIAAGETIRSVTQFLHTSGMGVRGIPAYGNITIGGILGTGPHGSSLKETSSITDEVVELLIVDGLGNLRRITQEEDLRAFRVNLGLLGVILQVTLRTVPLYKIRAFNQNYPDSILTNGRLNKMLEDNDHMSVYWFPAYHTVVVSAQTQLDANAVGNAFTNDHVPAIGFGMAFYMRRHIEVAQAENSTEFLNLIQASSAMTLTQKFPGFPPIYSTDNINVENPAVGYYHNMLAPPPCGRNGYVQCPWLHGEDGYSFLDQEISIDYNQLPNAVWMIQDILKKYPAVFPYQGILLRFSSASDSLMSVSYKRETCHIEFYMPLRDDSVNQPTLGLAAYQAITQGLVDKFGGKSHWGKSGAHFHSAKSLNRTIHPEAKKAFLSKVEELDPFGTFMNAFGNRLKGTGTAQDVDENTKHCALVDVCECSTNEDCGAMQECSRINGYPNYPVCITPEQISLPVLNILPLVKHVDPMIKFIKRILKYIHN